MKIAIISMIRDSWGGSEELWYDMAKTALLDGHKIFHLTYEVQAVHPKLKELIASGLVSYKRPGFRKTGQGRLPDYARLLFVFLRKKANLSFTRIFRERPDIVIYNGTCYSIAREKKLMDLITRSKTDFYIIGHLNSEKNRDVTDSQAQLVNKAYQRCKKVFFVSQRTKEVAERHLCSAISNAKIIRNPVNMKETTILDYPEIKDVVNFAIPANLVIAHKGQDILLSVLAQTKWKERDFHLNIYGSGPDKAYLESLTEFYQLKTKISFHGIINDIREVWKKNHLLLMPSHMEGMPLALVEAMLCGRPSVVTDVGGITEWVEEAVSGFIAEAATVNSFSKALEKAWTVKDQWKQIGLNAHHRASSLYDPQAGKTLLQEILNKK